MIKTGFQMVSGSRQIRQVNDLMHEQVASPRFAYTMHQIIRTYTTPEGAV